jgi:hypothetical protein
MANPTQQQVEFLKARNRQLKMVALLDSYDWYAEGYADKFAWLRDMYGPGRDDDLLLKCQQHFEQEGML